MHPQAPYKCNPTPSSMYNNTVQTSRPILVSLYHCHSICCDPTPSMGLRSSIHGQIGGPTLTSGCSGWFSFSLQRCLCHCCLLCPTLLLLPTTRADGCVLQTVVLEIHPVRDGVIIFQQSFHHNSILRRHSHLTRHIQHHEARHLSPPRRCLSPLRPCRW